MAFRGVVVVELLFPSLVLILFSAPEVAKSWFPRPIYLFCLFMADLIFYYGYGNGKCEILLYLGIDGVPQWLCWQLQRLVL